MCPKEKRQPVLFLRVRLRLWLQLPLPEGTLRAQARQLAASHSKASSRPYDVRVREREHQLLRTTYAKEVADAMRWAERYLLHALPVEAQSVAP